MIENIPTPLVSFVGSGFVGFFIGMFLRRLLRFLAIIIGSYLGTAGTTIHTYPDSQIIMNPEQLYMRVLVI